MSAPAFDLLAPGSAGVAVLMGARVSGMVLIAPVFASRNVPMMLKAGLIVILTVLLQPVAMTHAASAEVGPATVLAEVLVGFAIGLGVALLVGAAEAAGDLIAIQTGLAGAASLDPINHHQVPVLGQFLQLFAIALLLAVDAHLLMIEALAATVELLPVGGRLDLESGLHVMVAQGATLFVLGVRFAAPVLAAVMVANTALAILSRAAPTLNVLGIAFPLQIAIGLFTLAASAPLMAAVFSHWTPEYERGLRAVIDAFGGR